MAERRGLPAQTPGMRRMRQYTADVTGDTTDELELAALEKAARHFPGIPLEISETYGFHERHLTMREIRTGVAEGPGKELQAQIIVYELIPEVEL